MLHKFTSIAGLGGLDRTSIQESWQTGEVPVISATNSFGMGVDKATVRVVAHWGMPQNVASYYQVVRKKFRY